MTYYFKIKNQKNYLLSQITDYRLIILFFGLSLWLLIPILGIFPILLYIQLDLLRKKKPVHSKSIFNLNNFLLLLIVLTISIFIVSFDNFGDTLVYLRAYAELGKTGPFNVKLYGNTLEFLTLLLAYPTYLLSQGSTFWFLFNHTLIINLLITFIISRNFSKLYYPLILILVFSVNLYYAQTFYMRHLLSNVFLMLAISTIDSKKYFFCLPWSTFSHLSNFPFSLITLLVKIDQSYFKFIKNLFKYKTILKLVLILLICSLAITLKIYGSQIIISVLEVLIDLQGQIFGGNIGDYLQTKIVNNDARLNNIEYNFPIMAVIDTIVVGGLIILGKFKYDSKNLSLIGIYLVNLIAFIFVGITGFNWRVCLLFFSTSGFFYLLGIESKKSLVQSLIILLAVLKIMYFIFWLWRMDSQSYLVFFDGQPLSTTAYDYLVYFWDSITH